MLILLLHFFLMKEDRGNKNLGDVLILIPTEHYHTHERHTKTRPSSIDSHSVLYRLHIFFPFLTVAACESVFTFKKREKGDL